MKTWIWLGGLGLALATPAMAASPHSAGFAAAAPFMAGSDPALRVVDDDDDDGLSRRPRYRGDYERPRYRERYRYERDYDRYRPRYQDRRRYQDDDDD